MALFSKKQTRPKCIAFVDFEHWYIALERQYGVKPDIKGWKESLSETYDVEEIAVFGDFSNSGLRGELDKLRDVTPMVFDTKNSSEYYKKDFTDFIILDNIYQKALSREDINTFIIFTGDGHFSSVCAFLKNFCHKEVGIYGVQGGISSTLIKNSSWVREIPLEFELNAPYYNMIFTYLEKMGTQSDIYPTFRKTAETVASMYDVEFDTIKQLLSELINEGYITQLTKNIRRREQIRILEPNWSLIEKDGLWLKTSTFNN